MGANIGGCSRREFLRTAAGAAVMAAIGPLAGRANAAGKAPERRRMIGIQSGALAFKDEGVERVLDIMQGKAAVNTIFLETYAHGDRPGQPHSERVPTDHGHPDDPAFRTGGTFTAPHPEFYRGV